MTYEVPPELSGLDHRQAAGILARASLALESGNANPASHPRSPDELERRHKIIDRVERDLKSSQPESSAATLQECVSSVLQEIIDGLSPEIDTSEALRRLSDDGALSADAYGVSFKNYSEFDVADFGVDDKYLAEECIKSPDFEEHFGPRIHPSEKALVSLFGKWCLLGEARYLLLVAGNRENAVINVGQIWRVYPSIVSIQTSKNLLDILERFAFYYGEPFRLGGTWRGKFFREIVVDADPRSVGMSIEASRKGTATASAIVKEVNGTVVAAFGMCINLTYYTKDVKRMIKRYGS